MGYSPWGCERVIHNLTTKTTRKQKDLVNVFADLFKNVPRHREIRCLHNCYQMQKLNAI